jgi:hypothetical protein
VVILDSGIANTIENQLTPAYQSADVEFAFLSDINSAMAWLSDIDESLDKLQVEFFSAAFLF